MIDDFMPLGIERPGFFGNGTVYQSKGRWREGNFVRFHEGTIQPIGGWLQTDLTGTTVTGIAHDAVCWQFEDGTPYLAFGTTQGLFVIDALNVTHDITPISANINAPEYDWQLSVFGAFLMATNSLKGDQDRTKINVYVWQGDTAVKAVPAWTSSVGPKGAYACFATAERQFVTLRGEDPSTHTPRTGVDSAYSERRVYFSSTEELDGFVSTDTNTGGDFDLQTPGRLITGTNGKIQSFIWTDVDMWTMSFIGGDFIYAFKKEGDECGIISKRAFVKIDKGTYWMGRGKFFIFDGFTRSIPCEVTDAVFGNFNEQRAHTVWCFSNSRFNELTWFYPSAGAAFPDRYVTYNHVENHWVNGKLDRSCGVPKRFNHDTIDEAKPAFFDSVGNLFQHETGNERDGLAFLTSGPLEIANGDRLMRIQGIMDDTKASGDVALRLFTAMAANSLETTNGPYTLGPVTNLRLKARQVRLRLEEVTRASWRVGNPRLSVRAVERRGIGPGVVDNVPASLEIIPSTVVLVDSQHYTFEHIVRNAAGEVLDIDPDVWVSDNPTQAPIDQNGTITGLATPATAHVQAFITSPALSSNVATVTVQGSDIPVTIELSPTAEDVTAGGATQVLLTAVVKNNHGQVIVGQGIDQWLTSNSAKATITPTGGLNLTANVAGAVGATIGNAAITAKILTPVVVTSNPSVATVTDAFVTHTFTSTSQFHVTTLGTGLVRVLVVGAGGSGGDVCGTGVGAGGGGAGEAIDSLTASVAVIVGDNAVNIGGGGSPNLAISVPGLTVVDGFAGGQTSFASVTAHGGGAGSALGNGGSTQTGGGAAGGGGGGRGDGSLGSGGTGLASSGGSGSSAVGGGGGGAVGGGSPGGVGSGRISDITGTTISYATGGAGATITFGGGSTRVEAVAGTPGGVGTGNGGGGGKGGFFIEPDESGILLGGIVGLAAGSGAGGGGLVIVRYSISSGIVATGGVKVVHS
jgi:hypothetical protein